MSVAITISGDALPYLKRVKAAMESPRLRKVMAAQGAKTVRQNFRKLDRQRHRAGVPQHYYAGAARATTWEVTGSDAFINIDKVGIALRYFGGTVRPRKAKFLTIPVADEAQGRRAREFSNTSIIVNKRTGKGVIKSGDRVLFALTKEATSNPDPTVLPEDKTLLNDMTAALNRELDRI